MLVGPETSVRRSDERSFQPIADQLTPQRHRRKPPPPAFAEVFIRTGWRGVEEAYGSRTACNRRWIAECGEQELFAARKAYRKRLSAMKLARVA